MIAEECCNCEECFDADESPQPFVQNNLGGSKKKTTAGSSSSSSSSSSEKKANGKTRTALADHA